MSENDMIKQQRNSDMPPPSVPSVSINNNDPSIDNFADSQPSHEQPIQTAQAVAIQQSNTQQSTSHPSQT